MQLSRPTDAKQSAQLTYENWINTVDTWYTENETVDTWASTNVH